MTQFPFAKKTTVPIENLNARILAVANVNLIAINCDAVWKIELSGACSLHSPSRQEIAIFIKLQDSRVTFAIGDINISFVVKGNVGGLIEVEHIISRNSHPAQCQEHARGLWCERRVQDQREGREQHPQPLDLLRPGVPRQQRIDHRELHGASPDGAEHVVPRQGLGHVESRGGSPTQLVELDVRDRC